MNFEMKLQSEYFNYIKNGTKRIEIRLNDEKRRQIKLGDTIKFLKEPELDESLDAAVIGLLYYKDFETMFRDFSIDILADSSISKESLLKDLKKFYPDERVQKYGVVGIRFEKMQ